MWPVDADGLNYKGTAYTFTADDFGVVATASIPAGANQTTPTKQVGLIVRLRNWQEKDIPHDRLIPIVDGRAEIWLVSGDENMYTSAMDAATAVPRIINAYLEDKKTIVAALSHPLVLPLSISNAIVNDIVSTERLSVAALDTTLNCSAVLVGNLQHLLGAQSDWDPTDHATTLKRINANLYQFTGILPAGKYNYKIAFNDSWDGVFPANHLTLVVPPGGAKVIFSYVPFDLKTQQPHIYDSLNDPTSPLPLSSAGLQTSLVQITLEQEVDITHTIQLVLRGYLSSKVTPRNVLNSEEYVYDADDLGNTFTPQATQFRVWAPTASAVHVLLYNSETGPLTQRLLMEPGAKGTWYIEVKRNLENYYYLYQVTIHGTVHIAVDPYVRALAVNATRGMIIDLAKTDPAVWKSDTYQQLAHPVDAIIYETHVRDFSIDTNSGMQHKGQYLAFTERGTTGPDESVTGVDSLLQLGVTHIQVLPVVDFATIDETDPHQYNWGYDPRTYNVPEGAYASTPHGSARISEYKRMIQSLHASHLGVIMDVVYNHTFAVQSSDFDKIVPQYYYRTNFYGNYTNGSGVGNEFATERPMVQKFVRDSLQYWMREYHVDGFRFDLMALLGVDTMRKVTQDLHALNPHALIYGEPWMGGASELVGNQLLFKGRQKELGIGVFNDHIRNAVIGGALDAIAKGFATGEMARVDTIKRGIAGSIDDFTADPSETINYITSHDNLTLWDKITISAHTANEDERVKMAKLAQAIIFTAQGVPFMQGGEEFLRTKQGNDNSYNAGDGVNKFDWSRKTRYQSIFNYYAGLIHLRRDHPAFRMTSASAIRHNLTFLDSSSNTIAFLLNGHACGDTWQQIIVIYNPNTSNLIFKLPKGHWNIVANQNYVGEEVLNQVTDVVTAPALSCLILYNNDI